MTAPPKRRRLSARKRLLFALIMTLGPLLAAEGFFRAREWVRDRRKAERGALISPREPDTYRDMVLTPNRTLVLEGRTQTINSLGMRAPEPERPKPAGLARVVCVGASSTFGLYTSQNELTWPAQTQALLRAAGRADVEVLDAGCPAWTLRTSITNLDLRLFDALEPDVVIACHTYNDAMANLDPTYEKDSFAESPADVRRLLSGSALYRFLLTRFRPPRGLMQKVSAWRPEGLAAYERNLRFFVRRVRERGAVPVLITEPTCYRPTLEESVAAGVPGLERWFHELSPLEYPALLAALAAYNQRQRDLAKELGVALLDLEARMPHDVRFFNTPVHHSDEGERVFAGIVAEELTRLGLLD